MATRIGGWSWRLLGLVVLLLSVAYVNALLVSSDWLAPGAVFWIAASWLVLAGLAIAAVKRGFRARGVLLIFSAVASLCALGVLFGMLEVWARASGSSGPWRAWQAVFEYWPTWMITFGSIAYTVLDRPARPGVDHLLAVPVLAWGLDSTRLHWDTLSVDCMTGECYEVILGEAATESALTLLVLLVALAVWRYACGRRAPRLVQLLPIATSALVVFADWYFSLRVVSWALDQPPPTP